MLRGVMGRKNITGHFAVTVKQRIMGQHGLAC